MEIMVATEDLMCGMYVCRLDRPWLETPYPIQGFYIHDGEDIRRLQEHCEHVYVDTDAPEPTCQQGEIAQIDAATARLPIRGDERRSGKDRRQRRSSDLPKPQAVYVDKKPVEEEIETARELRTEVCQAIDAIMTNVQQGKKLDSNTAKAAVAKMTQSILRNPDAFMWLRLLKDKDNYTYMHCMDSSALAIAFGRSLGLSRRQLDDIGMGVLMCDVGKMRLPEELLNKPDKLTHDEFEIAKTHVAHSIRIMEKTGGFSKESIAIVAAHHERFDGSGYPRGLIGVEVPMLGRMASIVDCFDAIVSDTAYRRAISTHEAIRRIYEWRGSLFQAELVEQFIQTLGPYPTGSIVELTTDEVGIVISQSRSRRLKPKVMLVLDKDKKPYRTAPIVDLVEVNEDNEGNPLEVFKVLGPGAYGIDSREFYL